MIFISGSSLGAEHKLQITYANKVAEIDLVDGGKYALLYAYCGLGEFHRFRTP